MPINIQNETRWRLLKIALFLGVASFAFALSASRSAACEPLVATGVALDLIITLPTIYFFLIRRTSIPKITVVPLFGGSVTAAYFIVPASGQVVVSAALAYAIPAVELLAFGYIVLRLGRIVRAYRNVADEGADIVERLRTALSKELEPAALARAVAFETACVLFAVGKWRRPSGCQQFTYHRGAMAVLAAFLFLLAAESLVVHTVISIWSPIAAWIVTAVSLYFGVQLFGHLKAVLLRRLILTGDHLLLRGGLLADCQIALDQILEVARSETAVPAEEPSVMITPVGRMLRPNVRLNLASSATVYGIYGIPKAASSIEIYVDEPLRFIDAIRQQIQK